MSADLVDEARGLVLGEIGILYQVAHDLVPREEVARNDGEDEPAVIPDHRTHSRMVERHCPNGSRVTNVV